MAHQGVGLITVTVARKPCSTETTASNVILFGTGAINIRASRVPVEDHPDGGRWPANIIVNTSSAVHDMFPETVARGNIGSTKRGESKGVTGWGHGAPDGPHYPNDSGNATRFFIKVSS